MASKSKSTNGRMPTLPEYDAFNAELLSAAREGRDPKYKSVRDVMDEGLPEEMRVWGSPSQQLQGKEARYATRQHNEKTDKDQGLKSIEGTTQTAQTGYDEAQELLQEFHENQVKSNALAKKAGTVDPDAYKPTVYVEDAPVTAEKEAAVEEAEKV